MKRILVSALMLLAFSSCQQKNTTTKQASTSKVPEVINEADQKAENEMVLWTPYNDSLEVLANANHEKKRMRYTFIQSKVLDKNKVFLPLYNEVSQFPKEKYNRMRPMVLEQNIPTIQGHIASGKFTYEDLTLFYLTRIYKYELPNETTLNTIIALNPNILEQARALDSNAKGHHPIYGMPILLKDNIGARHMNTTAGAVALIENQTDDAFIVQQLKTHGALILGKVNLSEWANFICECPNGQSAVGGQTLNPYGRRMFDTGGSSAGSGTSTAANYAVAAIGTETSGSILSPSGQNAVVGMKPTIGLLSRTGIVPISSTLDTPGPMTKSVIDNGILLDAMRGFDAQDQRSVRADWEQGWYKPENASLKGKRFGVLKNYMERDSIYRLTADKFKQAGAIVVAFEPPKVEFEGFLSILNIDMKFDLPKYIETAVLNKEKVSVRTVKNVMDFNAKDSLTRIPYGQARFDGIMADTTSTEGLLNIKRRLKLAGRTYFNTPMNAHDLDAVLSINNYDAGAAAVAEYPALTIPMGYRDSGEPVNLTFIAKQFQEKELYELGQAFEALGKVREIPVGYKD